MYRTTKLTAIRPAISRIIRMLSILPPAPVENVIGLARSSSPTFSGEQRRKSCAAQHHHRPPAEGHGHAGPALQLGYAAVAQPSQRNRPDGEHIQRSRYGVKEVGTGVNQSAQVAGDRVLEGEGFTPDRKSTRLNSSHLGISYAAFCL